MFGFSEIPEWLQSDDKVFRFDSDWQNNACIAHAHRYFYDVAFGYEYTANRLAEQAMAGEVWIDAVIEPLVFMYRHWMELRLKHTIVQLSLLDNASRPIPVKGHGLIGLWDKMELAFTQHLSEDEREMLSRFRSVVVEFDELDPRGTAFRYPYDLDFKNELSEIRHINVRHLYAVMRDMSSLLDAIDFVIGQLLEYQAEIQPEYYEG